MNKLQGCPVEAFLKIIGQRWSSYILHILLLNQRLRFGELKRHIPNISQKVLTEKLRELEKADIIHRDYQNTIPPTVTYSLTKRGKSLSPLLKMISNIAHEWRLESYL